MKKSLPSILSILFVITAVSLTAADNKGKAVSLVKNTIKFYKTADRAKTLEAITAGKFKEGELYVFCYDANGVIIAHPENKALIGKNMLQVPDVDGKLFRKDIVETAKAKGKGWIDYKYKNPTTGKIESKTTYVEISGDIIFCCGTYK